MVFFFEMIELDILDIYSGNLNLTKQNSMKSLCIW